MTEERKGELYQFAGALMWAFFPVITILTYNRLPPLVSLGWSTLFSAGFFIVLVAIRNRWKEFLNWKLWLYSFGIVLFIGVIFYSLSFIGLAKTTSGNASIIALFQIFAGFVF